MGKTLFPHQTLDWSISRLEERAGTPDAGVDLELARALLSKGFFHGGGEPFCSKAHQFARKALRDEHPAEAHTLAGFSLVATGRLDAGERHLDQALEIDGERADLRLALGVLAKEKGDLGQAVRQLEFACRLAPEAWETHLFLGRALADMARPQGNPRRLIERSQYHLVRALQLEPTPDIVPSLLKDVGISCLLTGRYREAEKFFIRLREHDTYAAAVRYFLGQVYYNLGKHNNAVQHFRKCLEERPNDAKVLARMAMAYFQLGDFVRVRECCNQALVVDPHNLTARHMLGCAFIEEGQPNEALRVFKETLRDHPDHMPSYVEMARTRRAGGDVDWLVQALLTEVGQYDRLPFGGARNARGITRDRIAVVLDELRSAGATTAGAVLGAVHRTQDEGLRFQLWDAACHQASLAVGEAVTGKLRAIGHHYSDTLGLETVAAAAAVPEPVLANALQIDESDLKRNAVERHGPADDLARHRANLDAERAQAKAFQGLGLLALASRRTTSASNVLREWTKHPDPDLAFAAQAGLCLFADPAATAAVREKAALRSAEGMADRLIGLVTPPSRGAEPKLASSAPGQAHTLCSTCGRGPGEVAHFLAGGRAVLCDRCMIKIGQHRKSLTAPPDAVCDLCSRTPFEVQGLYAYNAVHVCSRCLEQSLGLLEREEVDQFLATW